MTRAASLSPIPGRCSQAVIEGWRNPLGDLIRHPKVVFTNGCFDLLHPGHLHLLFEASRLGDYLIVGLNSDASVAALKGTGRPVESQNLRRDHLLHLPYVDEVKIFDELTPIRLLREIQPNILVKGGDYTIDEVLGREYAKNTILVPRLDGFSSTGVINEILSKS